MNRERRISPFAEDALTVLNEAVDDADNGLPKTEAKAVLVLDDRSTETDAEYAPDLFQNRGYIYYVDECIRIASIDR